MIVVGVLSATAVFASVYVSPRAALRFDGPSAVACMGCLGAATFDRNGATWRDHGEPHWFRFSSRRVVVSRYLDGARRRGTAQTPSRNDSRPVGTWIHSETSWSATDATTCLTHRRHGRPTICSNHATTVHRSARICRGQRGRECRCGGSASGGLDASRTDG